MKNLTRFGVAVDQDLLTAFDRLLKKNSYRNRSEAIRDLIRTRLQDEFVKDPETHAFAVFSYVYDHHRRGLEDRLTDLQHDSRALIITSTHIHLDHAHCLEVILLKGSVRDLKSFSSSVSLLKGVERNSVSLIAL